MSTEFSFGQIEAICARHNRIASDKRVAFMGRLKQLQKHDIIDPDRRPGKGKAGTYSFSDLMRFVVAVELMQCGIMPQMAARLVNGSWDGLCYTIYVATYSDEEMDEWEEMPFGPTFGRDWYWMLTPEALREMTEEGFGRFDHMEAIIPVPLDEVAERLASDREIGVFGEGSRMIVLHGTKIAKAVIGLVEYQFRYATAKDMRCEIQEDFDRLKGLLENSPIQGVEEAAKLHFVTVVEAATARMESKTLRARYFPSEQVLARQAQRMVGKLKPYQLAFIRHEAFNGTETPDLRAMNDLMAQGLLVPDMEAGTLKLVLSPLGQAVQRLSAEVDIPAKTIENYRLSVRAKVEESVQRKITALLARDPDNPEDVEALDRWARHGGKAPLSEKRKKEVASKFIQGMRNELKDDPEEWDEFKATPDWIGGRDGDDKKA